MHKAAPHVLNAICATHWAITEEALAIIVAVALRENESLEVVEKRLGRPLDNTHDVTIRNGVATIPVSGPIARYMNIVTLVSGGTTIETLAQDLEQALTDPTVQAILLHVDSPGGDVNGMHEFAQMVYDARSVKPIWAYVGHMAASGGYWIASAASEIIIDPTALLGSIGVAGAIPDPADPKNARPVITFVSSQSPDKRPDPHSERGRAQLQREVDALAAVFVASVARNRGVSEETVLNDFGRGGLLVGQAAIDAHMADRLGSYEQVLAKLAAPTQPTPRVFGMSTQEQKRMGADGAEQPTQTTAAPAQSDMEARLAALQQQLAAEQRRRITTEASAFVEQTITASRVMPAARQALIDLYTQAAADDLNHPLPAAAGAVIAPTRTALVQALIAAQPAHRLTEERIPPGQSTQVLLGSNPAATTEEEADLAAADKSARAYASRANGKRPA